MACDHTFAALPAGDVTSTPLRAGPVMVGAGVAFGLRLRAVVRFVRWRETCLPSPMVSVDGVKEAAL